MKSKDEVIARLNRDICICDTTIRDSENAAGVVLSNTEKYRIAKGLDNAGVAQINVGVPSASEDEKKTVRRIARMGLNASIMATNRAERSDIEASLDAGVDSVSIALPISDLQLEARGWDRKWILDKYYDTIQFAKEQGLYVSYVMEDAPRASKPFLMKCALDAKDMGADRLVYSDTVGVADPSDTYDRIKTLVETTEMDIRVQMRNDFGMATANAYMAMKAGARFVDASLIGIGPRAGNASLEEVALVAEEILKIDTKIDLPALKAIADILSKASGRKIWESKPVFGSACFAQDGGINSVGGNDYNDILDPYDPALVGGVREIVIGKHSTVETIIYILKKENEDILPDKAERLTDLVKKNASDLHRSLTKEELLELYYDMENGDFDDYDDSDIVDVSRKDGFADEE